MHKLLTVALAALFSLGQSAAAHAAITAEPAGEVTLTSLGKITFSGGSIGYGCSWTLAGALNSEIDDAEGGEAGTLSSGSVEACTAGSVRPLFSSDWSLTLAEAMDLFEESHGEITINIVDVEFEHIAAGVTCVYGGTVPIELEASGSPLVSQLLAVLANTLSKVGGSIFCPSSGALSGSFELSPEQTLDLV